ncbi:uncharacterized protein AB675_8911 [Cyphellophora attinorum]|uniref:Uncharacterized protein n=1 Tax=Cyphellophora attinorum TaxID=1664694 RepID=A0A0N1NWB4_9EURO|nr:uncharacterized protein AB675_8911 [Phialophora attinorum]KPI36230.1 hypothetical protein AB675_8911 [Phialophora attinorum]
MSSIQFYTDDNCLDAGTLGNSSGPSNGLCTQFGESAFKSFRVVTLQRTCAVTIYGSDVAYCSSTNIGLASFGACMKNTTVNQFSVDCQDFQIANSDSPASYISPAATATGSSSTASASPSSSAAAAEDGLSTGAKAGIGAGIAVLVIAAVALGIFFVLRRRRNAGTTTTTANGLPQGGPGPQMGELQGDYRNPLEAPPGYSAGIVGSKNVAYWQKPPRVPNVAPVEAPGDHAYRGGLHEMESPAVVPGRNDAPLVTMARSDHGTVSSGHSGAASVVSPLSRTGPSQVSTLSTTR